MRSTSVRPEPSEHSDSKRQSDAVTSIIPKTNSLALSRLTVGFKQIRSPQNSLSFRAKTRKLSTCFHQLSFFLTARLAISGRLHNCLFFIFLHLHFPLCSLPRKLTSNLINIPHLTANLINFCRASFSISNPILHLHSSAHSRSRMVRRAVPPHLSLSLSPFILLLLAALLPSAVECSDVWGALQVYGSSQLLIGVEELEISIDVRWRRHWFSLWLCYGTHYAIDIQYVVDVVLKIRDWVNLELWMIPRIKSSNYKLQRSHTCRIATTPRTRPSRWYSVRIM